MRNNKCVGTHFFQRSPLPCAFCKLSSLGSRLLDTQSVRNILSLFKLDFWLDYIKIELKHGDSEMVSKLHWRAMKCLSGDNVEQFVTKYTLLQHSL